MQLKKGLLMGRASRRTGLQYSTGILFLGLFAIVISGAMVQRCSADEEYSRFLTALRDRGTARQDVTYFELAFDYLESLEKSDLISDAIKQTLGFEKGKLLIASTQFIRNKKQRLATLEQGKSMLQDFVEKNPTHPYSAEANNELANLLILSARRKIQEDDGKNGQLVTDARTDYASAGQIVIDTRDQLREQLKKLPPNPTDQRLRERQEHLRGEFLRARLMLPQIQEEISDTYPNGSPQWKQSLEAAIQEYADISADYKRIATGYLAMMRHGRILSKLGKYEDALSVFRNIFEQEGEGFREVKKQALGLVYPIWLKDDLKEKGFVEAVKVTEPILNALTPQEERDPEWLSIRLQFAKACRKYHELLLAKPDKTQADKVNVKKLLQVSNDAARFVATSASPIKSEAQKLLVSWGVRVNVESVTAAPPTSFVEARERAGKIISQYELLKKEADALTQQIEADPTKKDALSKQLSEIEQSLLKAPKDAIRLYQMAMSLSTDDTPIDDINIVRYRLCFCYYALNDYMRAGLIGEFMANRFRTFAGAQQSAELAMYAYWNLYTTATEGNRSFEESKVNVMCSRILDFWPKSDSAAEAVRMLISISIQAGDLDRVLTLLEKIPADSIHRGAIELNTGQAFWVSYRQKIKASEEAGTLDADRPKLEAIRSQAEQFLANGQKAATKDNIDRSKAKSLLALAKIYAEKKEGGKAIGILDDADIGILTLIRNNVPFAQEPGFQLDALRTALKCYVQTITPSSDATAISASMTRASKVMDDLKKLTQKLENGDRMLVALYYSFASEIKERMDSLSSVAAKKNFSAGLKSFLEGAAESSNDIKINMWAASTLIKVGDSFVAAKEDAAAADLFAGALGIMNKIADKKIELTDADKLEILRQEGNALKGTGKYAEARKKYVEYLGVKSTTLDVQIAAAMTYQLEGEKSGDKKLVAKAILGGEPEDPKAARPKKKIWGWGKLSLAVSRNPKFKKYYLEARLNLSRCRMIYGRIDGKTSHFQTALKEVGATREKYSDLGDARMKKEFEQLEIELKNELNK